VTEADLAAQETVRKIVLGAFPGHSLLGEEDPVHAVPHPRTEYRWVVDPLDGTTNYVHQVPFFCVSLALERRGELLVGGIYNPVSDECFMAVSGQGAYLNGSRIRVSQVAALDHALVAMGFPAVVTAESPDLRLFQTAVYACQSMRRTGSAALNLAYVAAGRFDAAWTYATKPWDVAAGTLLVREAGGTITAFDGTEVRVDRADVIAANSPGLHGQMMMLVRKAGIAL
jgi:myo-inositol-1(or 4)-monophosphatase